MSAARGCLFADRCHIKPACFSEACLDYRVGSTPLIPLDPAAVSSPRVGSPADVLAAYPPVTEHSAADDLAEIRRLKLDAEERVNLAIHDDRRPQDDPQHASFENGWSL